MARKLVASTSPYAPIFGFSRVVRVGNFISVGGTAPMDANGKTTSLEPACSSRASKTGRSSPAVDTVMQAAAFVNKDWLVEVGVDAVVDRA